MQQLHTVAPEDRLPAIVPIEIYTDYKPQPDGSYAEEERIKWVRKGANGAETSESVRRLTRDGGPIWQVLKPHYDAWKAGKEAPVDGLKLEAWPGGTAPLVKALASFHIRTVEDLANLEDAALVKVSIPGIRSIRQNAKAFVEAQRNAAPLAGKLSALETENENLKNELAELRELVSSLAAERGIDVTDEPKRRGRPPKAA
jgi:hypothetical protein